MGRIGLLNLEPKVTNTALMQISQYHKQRGDKVEWYLPVCYDEYDKVYVASLFSTTRKPKLKPKFICGGTGFDDYDHDIITRLPPEIEACNLDYSLYPNCKTSYLWFSRGCIHKCPYCVVWKKEGMIHSVEPKNLNPKGETITIIDNNPFKNPRWEEMIDFCIEQNRPVNFCSGVSLRDFEDSHGLAIQKLKLFHQLNVAWDNPRENLRPKIEQLLKFIPAKLVQCYVLVEYWSTKEEDMMRIDYLRSKGIDPYVMPYKKTRYAKDLARWCNTRKIIKVSPKFEDYDRKKYNKTPEVPIINQTKNLGDIFG